MEKFSRFAIFLTVFLAFFAIHETDAEGQMRICGKRLINLMKQICNHRYRPTEMGNDYKKNILQ